MKVLVVDDEEPFRQLMETRLGSRHHVECVPDGESALERLAARTFDMVLLDLRMPGIGSLEALKRMHDEHVSCEVVVLTGEPDYDDCVQAMQLGAFHYLRKPTEPALIEDTLNRAVEHV